MASPTVSFSNLDVVLRDMVKQNAALLELVAYGDSVTPGAEEFEREHINFVNNVHKAFNRTPTFVISAVDAAELQVLGSFDRGPVHYEPRPDGNLFEWLMAAASKRTGTLGAMITEWAKKNDQEHTAVIHVIPYEVTLEFGDVLAEGVQGTFSRLRKDENRRQLETFIRTAPVPFHRRDVSATPNAYFRAYACLGITSEKRDSILETGNLDALLETLMIFYQMSWSNLGLIKASEKKSKELQEVDLRAREREAAMTYAMIQDPVRQLVEQLDAIKEPLTRLTAALSPIKGLFGSSVLGDEYFMSGLQTFRIATGPYQIQVCHNFSEFYRVAKNKEIATATEQIAVAVLSGLEELRAAKTPVWDYMRLCLRFTDKYRRVARILLQTHANLQRESSDLMVEEVRDLFEMTKYWFSGAGRVDKPMRVDFLVAGLKLLSAEDASGVSVTHKGIDHAVLFWVPSTTPLQTVSGLEALCREYGVLSFADLQLTQREDNRIVRLNLTFKSDSAAPITAEDMENIIKSCNDFQAQRSVTRGNMTFAILQLFGGVPNYQPGTLEFSIQKRSGRASLQFAQGATSRITLEWDAPTPEEDSQEG